MTSGGLLIAVAPGVAGEIPGSVIGHLSGGDPGQIFVS
jgi:hypothetical protein